MPSTRKNVEVIFRPGKSVLYNDGGPYMRKEGGSSDDTMGAYDRVEKCEPIAIYMLYLVGRKYNSKNIGLYRDDRLAVLKIVIGRVSRKMNKQLQSLFNRTGLEIIMNLKVVNYLNVTFNLNDQPYQKPNDEKNYIQMQSDHPPSITKGFPLKSTHYSHYRQKIYCTKRHHVMSKA